MEELHGDWQHMTTKEVSDAAEEATLATGGEGAVELEATAPTGDAGAPGATEVVDPISEAARDAIRGRQEFLGSVDVRHLVPGPNGQMISGRNN